MKATEFNELEDLLMEARDKYPRDSRDIPSSELAELILAAGYRRSHESEEAADALERANARIRAAVKYLEEDPGVDLSEMMPGRIVLDYLTEPDGA